MILGAETATLMQIRTVMTEKTGVVDVLSADIPSLPPQDVDELPAGYEMAPGSRIVTPDRDYILFEEGWEVKQ